jgi:tetratricopeptide (TPR) repeat protein
VAGEKADDSSSAARHLPPATFKIADFGLAKSLTLTTEQTASGAVLGTPSYMAPEQAAASKDVGPAADVYALGAILYECLTGRPPFKAASSVETLLQVRTQEPVPPSRLAPLVPRDLETICLKCLEKEPRRRYDGARALAEDLGRFLAGEPIHARPTPVWERGLKWARRKPAAAALVLVSLVAALALLAVGLAYNAALRTALGEANSRRQEAEANLEEARGNFELAREAVNASIDRADRDPRLRARGQEGLRKDLLLSALAFYQKLTRRRFGDTLEDRAELGMAYHNLGLVLRLLGQLSAAEDAFAKALAVRERLGQAHPDGVSQQADLADTLRYVALVHRELGRPDEAEKGYFKAQEILERLARREPQSPARQADLATNYNNLAALFMTRRQFDRALDACRKGLDLYERLTAQHPDVVTYQASRAHSQLTLGALYNDLNQLEPAERANRAAVRLWQELSQKHPAVAAYQVHLAEVHNNLSVTLLRQQRAPAAEKELHTARTILEGLARETPATPEQTLSLAATYNNLGKAGQARADPAAALRWYGRGVRVALGILRDEPRHAQARHFFNVLHGNLAAAWPKAGEKALPPALLFELAGTYALSVAPAKRDPGRKAAERDKLAERHAAKSVALLRRVRDTGYYGDRGLAGKVGADPSFEALRDRADFREALTGASRDR